MTLRVHRTIYRLVYGCVIVVTMRGEKLAQKQSENCLMML